MTAPITKAAAGASADGVHRLVDMVVEEVSLVDRAANKHRFLIVKRDDAMDDNKQASAETEQTTDKGAPGASQTEVSMAVAGDSSLGAALAALESLTAMVELLGSLGADSSDQRLAALAEQLRSTAEQILERTGYGTADAEVESRAKHGNEPKTDSGGPFASQVDAAKLALSRLAQLATQLPPTKTDKREEPVAAPDTPALTESFAKLADSFRALSETVKEQQQRLGRVEKQFGLPNSATSGEHAPAARDEDVGWPLDLNKPKDRESVDKAVSFHDL